MSEVVVQAAVASRDVELDVVLEAGLCTAILGPNGAGKSTLLELISGTLRPSSGAVRIGESVVASNQGFVPTQHRGIGLLSQNPLLFPHLTALENVAFGPRSRGMGRAAAHKRARAQLQQLDCANLADQNAAKVSGGQAQRIGLARALATDPALLLLDEPLAALDAVTAPQMREVLRENLTGRTTALVTHDLLDVLVLAQRVVVLNAGRVVAAGPTAEIFARPRDEFLAQFLGVNVLAGQKRGASLQLAPGVAVQGMSQGPENAVQGWASFPATAVTLHRVDPGGSARNLLQGVVRGIEPRGPVARVLCEVAGQQIAADVMGQSVAQLGIAVGEAVMLAIKATAVAIY